MRNERGSRREAGTPFACCGRDKLAPMARPTCSGMTQILQRTVLFADLRGSTSMYESLGNADATAVVTQSVALLARIVADHDGQVVKTLGDGLMAMFETAGRRVAAADDMHDSLARIGMADDDPPARARQRIDASDEDPRSGAPTLPPRPPVPLKLQVGLAHGEVVEMARRRLRRRRQRRRAPARPRRRQRDPGHRQRRRAARRVERSRFRSLDRMQLRGRVEPVHVHLLEAVRRFGDTAATAFGDMLSRSPSPKASAWSGST